MKHKTPTIAYGEFTGDAFFIGSRTQPHSIVDCYQVIIGHFVLVWCPIAQPDIVHTHRFHVGAHAGADGNHARMMEELQHIDDLAKTMGAVIETADG